MPFEVLYEDNHLILVNKPFGALVHSDRTGDQTLRDAVAQYLKKKYRKPGNVFVGLVHRLDRPVSGVIMFARTSKALDRMALQFKKRKIDKVYWAIAHRMPNAVEGTVKQYLYKDTGRNVVRAYSRPGPNLKFAETRYQVVATLKDHVLFRLEPVTGRSHQLRVMMQSLGCPIAGDVKYGGKRGSNPRMIYLHAHALTCMHPTTREQLHVVAPPPQTGLWKDLDPGLFAEPGI